MGKATQTIRGKRAAVVGELPDWAIARIDRYLQDHCSDPGSC